MGGKMPISCLSSEIGIFFFLIYVTQSCTVAYEEGGKKTVGPTMTYYPIEESSRGICWIKVIVTFFIFRFSSALKCGNYYEHRSSLV
uniref:Secreted protein n=1 Tax=Pyxicephalus adspersus TaxID=30357 RepID=A0AAV3AAY6_PYXAD|nr:TPA: hypothetical protein GDO54_014559 [Pyxicephalus adspersus]